MPDDQKSFWTTVPGIITATATLITAIGGFVVVLHQVGVFGSKSESPKKMAEMSQAEGNTKQQELEEKIKLMEQKLAEKGGEPDRPSSDPIITAQPKRNAPFQNTAQLGGTWNAPDGSYVIIRQNGVSFTVEQYYNLYGNATRIAWGQGTVMTRKAFIDFIDLEGNTGRSEISISDDNRTMTGVARYANGAATDIYMTRSFDN